MVPLHGLTTMKMNSRIDKTVARAIAVLLAGIITLSCGGGGGGKLPANTPNSPGNFLLAFIFPTAPITITKDVDTALSFTPTANGSISFFIPFAWTVTDIPPGLTFSVYNDHTAVLKGRPTTVGTFNTHFTAKNKDTGLTMADGTVIITVDSAFKFVSTSLPDPVQGLPYAQTLGVANGVAPITWQIVSGVLPAGFNLNANSGSISGTSNDNLTGYFLRLRATDSSVPARTVEQDFSPLFIMRAQLQFNDQTLDFTRASNIGRTVQFSGGVPPVTLQIISGSLPPGLSLHSEDISGIATQTGSFPVTIQAADSYPQVKTALITIHVNEPVPFIRATLPHAIVGAPYSYKFSSIGGAKPLTWAGVSGLPPGLSVAPDGTLGGTPTLAGSFNIGVHVTDSSPTPQVGGSGFPIKVLATDPGRNDSIATATPLSNGIFNNLSFSPYANASGVVQPDQDYYKVVIAPSGMLFVSAAHGFIPSTADPVMEFVDANGTRLSNCQLPNTSAFNAPCLNDDVDPGINRDAQLSIKNTTSSDMTVYIHVLDWTGNARPDLTYNLTILGAK